MKEVILVPISGGLDSTYMLWHFLTNTSYDIHAHHISLRAGWIQRWMAEDEVIPKIVEYCKGIRNFEYSTSLFSCNLNNTTKDSDVVFTIASRVASTISKTYGVKVTLATGVCLDDMEHDNNRERVETINGNLWKALVDSVTTIKENNVDINPELYRVLLDEKVSKQDMVDRMPRELTDLTWSCRIPVRVGDTLSECGECTSCKQRRELTK